MSCNAETFSEKVEVVPITMEGFAQPYAMGLTGRVTVKLPGSRPTLRPLIRSRASSSAPRKKV